MHVQTRRRFLQQVSAGLGTASTGALLATATSKCMAGAPRPSFEVGAYYFPNYHVDPRNEKRYGAGWTEWELVKAARPRFPGHRQPRVPAWGYGNEADPGVMEAKINAAADHGLNYWIFDWYWYDDRPFLDRCLEKGYFGATNNRRVKFCCMWANHNWVELFPAHRNRPHKLLYPGAVSRATFDRIVNHVVGRYFQHPSHWKIKGCPYFSIYDVKQLVTSFGGIDATRRVLDSFREKTRRAGFPDLHLNAVMWGSALRSADGQPVAPGQLVRRLGFDSVTSYVWVHHVGLPKLETDYQFVQEKYFQYWDRADKRFEVPYYPNVSVGWDSSPRTDQSETYGNYGYPFTNTISGNTPERFRAALLATRRRLEEHPDSPRILNINSWNEWTEGSYLEPDTTNQLGYLRAIKSVFGSA